MMCFLGDDASGDSQAHVHGVWLAWKKRLLYHNTLSLPQPCALSLRMHPGIGIDYTGPLCILTSQTMREKCLQEMGVFGTKETPNNVI